MSGFHKRVHLLLFVDFELAVLGVRTVDELFVTLRCASIAAPVPEIRSIKVRNTLSAIMRNAYGLTLRYYTWRRRNYSFWFEAQERTVVFKLGQVVETIPQVRKTQKSECTDNITLLHVLFPSGILYIATRRFFCQIRSHICVRLRGTIN